MKDSDTFALLALAAAGAAVLYYTQKGPEPAPATTPFAPPPPTGGTPERVVSVGQLGSELSWRMYPGSVLEGWASVPAGVYVANQQADAGDAPTVGVWLAARMAAGLKVYRAPTPIATAGTSVRLYVAASVAPPGWYRVVP